MGRDIQAIKISGDERRIYGEKLRRSLDVLTRMLRERMFEDGPSQVGLEVELNLVGAELAPSMRSAQVLDAVVDPAWGTELGQFNLEINVPPRRLAGRFLLLSCVARRCRLDAAALCAPRFAATHRAPGPGHRAPGTGPPRSVDAICSV